MSTLSIEGQVISDAYRVWRFQLPHLSSYVKINLDGWLNTAKKCGVVKAILKINGKTIDTCSKFTNIPNNTVEFLGSHPLRAYALIYSDVTVEVIAEAEVAGKITLDQTEYGSRYNRYAGVVYTDQFVNGDGLPATIVYEFGMANVH